MFKEINGVNDDVKELVSYYENEEIEVTKELIIHWITEILDDINKEDISKVAFHLLEVEHTKENLLEVYSFVNECFDEKMDQEV